MGLRKVSIVRDLATSFITWVKSQLPFPLLSVTKMRFWDPSGYGFWTDRILGQNKCSHWRPHLRHSKPSRVTNDILLNLIHGKSIILIKYRLDYISNKCKTIDWFHQNQNHSNPVYKTKAKILPNSVIQSIKLKPKCFPNSVIQSIKLKPKYFQTVSSSQ